MTLYDFVIFNLTDWTIIMNKAMCIIWVSHMNQIGCQMADLRNIFIYCEVTKLGNEKPVMMSLDNHMLLDTNSMHLDNKIYL